MKETFEKGVRGLTERLGPDMSRWEYGQKALKHIEISHPLRGLVADSLSRGWDLGPLPRGGNGYTPGSTGNNYNQSSGATFRIIVPVGDWDRSLGINSPGQSGDPESPYYDNLFERWAEDRYFPLYYSRDSIVVNADSKWTLHPED